MWRFKMENYRHILLILMMVTVCVNGEDIIEEDVTEDFSSLLEKPIPINNIPSTAEIPILPSLSANIHSNLPLSNDETDESKSNPPTGGWSHPPSAGWSHPPSAGWSHPPSGGWSPPPSSGWSHPPSPPPVCKTYPGCNALNASCCECKNDLRKCCADGNSSNKEGYCLGDSCQNCVNLGKDCWHSNQCCGNSAKSASCQNWKCCLPLGSTSCTSDDDCCQPNPPNVVFGASCKSTGGSKVVVSPTCTSCVKDGQSCTGSTSCCGNSICGDKVSFTFDLVSLQVCCLPPGSACIYRVSQCCDSRSCPAGATIDYFCKPTSAAMRENASKTIEEEDKSGWGWGWSGWGNQDTDHGTLPAGLSTSSGYIKGVCTKCPAEGESCSVETDCCNGFKCDAGKCKSNFLFAPQIPVS